MSTDEIKTGNINTKTKIAVTRKRMYVSNRRQGTTSTLQIHEFIQECQANTIDKQPTKASPSPSPINDANKCFLTKNRYLNLFKAIIYSTNLVSNNKNIYIHCVPKKHVTTFSMISWSRTVRLQKPNIFGTLITKSIGHRQVYLVSHLTYFVHLLYLGKLSRPKYHKFSVKFLIFSMLQY